VAKRLTRMALLTAIALIIFIVEAQIPAPVPIPGIKLGLANIITVYAMFRLGPKDTAAILLCRIFLGSVFSGQMTTFFYSLGGGLLAYLAMLALRRVLTEKQLWVCGAIAAVCHNIGQMAVAILIFRTFELIVYLPVLCLSGLVTGVFTGLCAQFLLGRLKH